MSWSTTLAEQGWLTDGLVSLGIRRLLAERLRESYDRGVEGRRVQQQALISELRRGPLAVAVDEANEQHYELPPEFFQSVLGPRLKYSCAWFPEESTTLAQAEELMLALTCERAALADGQTILELGCGWGSLSLWMAEHFPASQIVAVSNSHAQRRYIEGRRDALGFKHLRVMTCDINEFDPGAQFDRVVSVEMFEHVRNYELLFARIARWLHPEGRLFAHIFCHREVAYPFEVTGDNDWMSRYFFTGGIMPSYDLFASFDRDLEIETRWSVSGLHYARTCRAWLARQDASRRALRPLFVETYGAEQSALWWQRWRMFFLACAELFAFHGGEEWHVGHYRFRRRER